MKFFDASCFCRGAEQLVVKTTPAHAKEVPTRKTYVYQRPQLGDTIFYASEYCNDTVTQCLHHATLAYTLRVYTYIVHNVANNNC